MTYIVVVFNKKGLEVWRKEFKNYSATEMHEIYKDYAHHGGPGGYADFFPL